jgi:hypothetical protein
VAPAPGEAAVGDATATPGQEAPRPEPGTRPARPRNRRRRRAPSADAAASNAGEHRPREAGAPSAPRNRPGERGNAARRDAPRETRRDAGPRPNPPGNPAGAQRDRRPDQGRAQGRNRPPGRGRDGPPRRVERQLYSVDAVVDRGFEDVEEEAGTRRVHWTIVKRTTADQVSRKPVSAVYVVQRDGVDSEFPNLGGARNAVNKTIVHPEKLTRSKAEYTAEKNEKK